MIVGRMHGTSAAVAVAAVLVSPVGVVEAVVAAVDDAEAA